MKHFVIISKNDFGMRSFFFRNDDEMFHLLQTFKKELQKKSKSLTKIILTKQKFAEKTTRSFCRDFYRNFNRNFFSNLFQFLKLSNYERNKTCSNISEQKIKSFSRSRLVIYRMTTEIVQALSSQQRKTFHFAFQFSKQSIKAPIIRYCFLLCFLLSISAGECNQNFES